MLDFVSIYVKLCQDVECNSTSKREVNKRECCFVLYSNFWDRYAAVAQLIQDGAILGSRNIFVLRSIQKVQNKKSASIMTKNWNFLISYIL